MRAESYIYGTARYHCKTDINENSIPVAVSSTVTTAKPLVFILSIIIWAAAAAFSPPK
jgi:hypothetical protein